MSATPGTNSSGFKYIFPAQGWIFVRNTADEHSTSLISSYPNKFGKFLNSEATFFQKAAKAFWKISQLKSHNTYLESIFVIINILKWFSGSSSEIVVSPHMLCTILFIRKSAWSIDWIGWINREGKVIFIRLCSPSYVIIQCKYLNGKVNKIRINSSVWIPSN